MSGKKKIYEAMLDGAGRGLADEALHAHVLARCPKASSKKIVRASLLALEDPDLKDGKILHAIYALAIKHRLEPVKAGDAGNGSDGKRKGGNDKKGSRAGTARDATPAVPRE